MKKARISIISSGTKAVFLIPLVLTFAAYGLVGCERSAHLVVTTDNPPVIKVSGDALFDHLEVYGPLPEKMDNDTPSLIWKIVASSSPPQLNKLPAITYGVVPDGFLQAEPNTGKPPDLLEGAIYNIAVTTRGWNHPAKTIVIRNGKAEELKQGEYKVDNSNVSSFVPTDVRTLHGTGRICFVPVNYSPSLLEQVAGYERQKYGFQVEIKPNLGSFNDTYDEQTGQHVAEKIIAILKQKYPPSTSAERTIYIALLPQDIYIKRQKSRFAYIYNQEGYAVISDARLAISANESQQKARVRKLINRAIGILYFNLPYSDDRRSVLFKDLTGPDDLDRMSEDF